MEKALWKIIPPEEGSDFCHRLVYHGRAVCDARKPNCAVCCLKDVCAESSRASVADEKRLNYGERNLARQPRRDGSFTRAQRRESDEINRHDPNSFSAIFFADSPFRLPFAGSFSYDAGGLFLTASTKISISPI